MLHFPKLQWIWSPSPAYTARLFRRLKRNRFEPDLENARSAGQVDLANEVGVNVRAVEVLRSCPGITAKNIYKVITNYYHYVSGIVMVYYLHFGEVLEIIATDTGVAMDIIRCKECFPLSIKMFFVVIHCFCESCFWLINIASMLLGTESRRLVCGACWRKGRL